MHILSRLLGLLAVLGYALQRAKIGFLRLRVGAIILCCLYAASTAYRGWQAGFSPSHGAIIALSLLLPAALLWADQNCYIVFHKQPALSTPGAPDLRVEERLFLRGSGTFEVNNMTRYLVEVPVVFWTTQLADHVLAAKVRALNVLGVGVPSEERGWWYMFIEPKHVREVTPGHMYFGFGLRPAVRIRCEAQKGHELIYLSCDSRDQQMKLLKELQSKAQAARQCTA